VPKRVQVNKHIVEFPDDMSPDAIKFVLHKNMGKLSDTQYHLDRDPFYQKASEASGSQEPPAGLSRSVGVTTKFPSGGYYDFPSGAAPGNAALRTDEPGPHQFKDYRIESTAQPQTLQRAIPAGAELKAQDVGVLGRKSQSGRDKTLGEIISYIKDAPDIKERTNRLRESIGRFVAPLVGLDYDEQAASNVLKQMVVFHGSPHVFEKFDVSKIGTGEGAQAYGHGLYFAENPGVATQYRNAIGRGSDAGAASITLGGKPVPTKWNDLLAFESDPVKRDAIRAVQQNQGNIDSALNFYSMDKAREQAVKREIESLRGRVSVVKEAGQLYQADIPDELTAKMLHWDKPFSQQSPEVQKALGSLGYEDRRYLVKGVAYNSKAAAERAATAKGIPLADIYQGEPDTMVGGNFYQDLSKRLGSDEAASKALEKSGLPGIRYFDQGSRAAGEGTHNIVVFNPDILENVTRK
jgi:hypothetical protein